VGERLGDDAAAQSALLGLREALERERFAASGSTAAVSAERGRELVSWVGDVSRGLAARSSRRVRLSAALLPVSQLRTARPVRRPRVGRPA
jgi:hypothetical protein